MNQKELRIIGMSRSGNHAIINWILAQAAGRTCFLNCTEPKYNPFATARPLDDGRCAIVSYPGFDLEAERKGRLTPKDLLIYSHEDCFLGTMNRGAFAERHDEMVGASVERRDVLILRDPFNLFASRLHGGFGVVSRQTAMRIWKQHAREFLRLRQYLGEDRVAISYNRWVADRSYRRRIATELGLTFSDCRLDEVPAAGNGSSFDGRRFHGAADRMKTTERWRHFAGDPAYRRLFDLDVQTLARRIFGDVGFEALGPRASGGDLEPVSARG